MLPVIDARLQQYLDVVPKGSFLDRYLYGILQEFVARGGKRVRPAMTMMACEAVGGDPLRALSERLRHRVLPRRRAHPRRHHGWQRDPARREVRPPSPRRSLWPSTPAISRWGLVCTIVVRDEGLDDATKIAVLDAIGEMSQRTIEGQALDVGWVQGRCLRSEGGRLPGHGVWTRPATTRASLPSRSGR